ncbi:MAG: FAD-binding and (Fe-S)-binding domain-containing protein [Phocaeicola sp.]|uniref:FAD-binding and (Fe-S)-binding domain-containing protein n=1 Tax=Phocaeicola sp. TaxID=2773926 RepID=UPI003F9FF77E
MINNQYIEFLREAKLLIPQNRIYTDELRRLAWGTDAGFYRMIPQIIIRSANEEEVSQLLSLANKYKLPVTFRAAGTSLSGQAISDSILIIAGKHWEEYHIAEDRLSVSLQPGIIGEKVNEILAPFGRKFAPDPASIKSAMVGGIVINNASGMSCGTKGNSDKMLLSAKLVFTDGSMLNTADVNSRKRFETNHPSFIPQLIAIREKIRANKKLCDRIKYKYAIKNVTGLNILPFVRFNDPYDIITHLMVGSEGTLAFLSEVTMRTEYDYPFKASAMLYFKTIKEACKAVVDMKGITDIQDTQEGTFNPFPVKAAELLDWKSLASVSDPIYLEYKKDNDNKTTEGLTAILTETRASSVEELQRNISAIQKVLQNHETYIPVHFTDKPEEYSKFWAIRSGIFPAVGGTRKPGTTCLIEDVAFHIEDLPNATADLQQLLTRHGYDDACIYGHSLEGNYHFIINQSFESEDEVNRYEKLMTEVKTLVVDKYDGSLKAEHGTGRNMAPFVRYEWGDDAFEIMKEVKHLFDPNNLLNPGVIFNDDPKCYVKNFKPLPLIPLPQDNPVSKVNRCIECGFCEVNCVSCGFTLSSRQRIVIQREISRLKQSGENPDRVTLLEKQFDYSGNQTCAGDGLCSMSCPMGINVGDLTHLIREQHLPKNSFGYKIGNYFGVHLSEIKGALRPILSLANFGHTVIGTKTMTDITKGMHHLIGIPLWTSAMPKAYYKKEIPVSKTEPNKVVYFPSCINQTMGLAKNSPVKEPLINKMVTLLEKGGYEVVYPKGMQNLCCGTIWESKGMPDIADRKTKELEDALWTASEHGKYPILCDQSPCLHRMRKKITKMKLYEPVEFIYVYLKDKLEFTQTNRPVAIHITCSTREMGLADMLINLAKLCSTKVLIPEGVGCCAFAGDKGFTHPELNAYALRKLRPQIEKEKIKIGYSNSRTCEIGLTTHSGIPYISIAYLVDECTKTKNKNNIS